MTASQNARLQMHAAVKVTCNANTPAWTTFVPFAAPFTDFIDALIAVDGLIGQQGTKSQGVKLIKDQQRRDLDAIVNQVSASLVLYGSLNNLPIAGEAYMAPSDVKKMSEKEIVGHADKLGSLAVGLTAPELATVKLTAGDLTNLEGRRVAFRDAIGSPRQKRVVSREATALLEKKIVEITDLLEQMDKAAIVLSFSEPEFYGEYLGAREIIDPGYSTRQLTVRIVAATSGAEVEGVEAIINPGNIRKLSGRAGIFFINNMPPGTYTMTLTSKSHQPRTEQFNIAANQATIVEVLMVPNP